MNLDSIFTFVRSAAPPVGWVLLALFALAILYAIGDELVKKLGIFVWYGVALAVPLAWAFWSKDFAYFAAFSLGMVAAFAEIIGKFRDEPLKALRTTEALIYHVLNGVIAAFALKLLILLNFPVSSQLDKIKTVATAGLGSMLIMRSKLFDIKTKDGDQSFSFGPEQILKVYFTFMQQAIDRVRAQSRIDFVTSVMNKIDYASVSDYTCTMLAAFQTPDEAEMNQLRQQIEKIRSDAPPDPQLKSYRLGFVLLDAKGENFLSKLFGQPRPEWRLGARTPDEIGQGPRIPLFGSKPEYAYYFAYGSNMSTGKLFERLRWSIAEKDKYLGAGPQKAELKGFRLVFNKPAEENPLQQGFANIVPDPNQTVQGIVYLLPRENVDFLYNKYEKGYRQEKIKVQLNGKEVDALTFMADSPKDGLKPTKEYLDTLVAGASEHRMSDSLIEKLRNEDTLIA